MNYCAMERHQTRKRALSPINRLEDGIKQIQKIESAVEAIIASTAFIICSIWNNALPIYTLYSNKIQGISCP